MVIGFALIYLVKYYTTPNKNFNC